MTSILPPLGPRFRPQHPGLCSAGLSLVYCLEDLHSLLRKVSPPAQILSLALLSFQPAIRQMSVWLVPEAVLQGSRCQGLKLSPGVPV